MAHIDGWLYIEINTDGAIDCLLFRIDALNTPTDHLYSQEFEKQKHALMESYGFQRTYVQFVYISSLPPPNVTRATLNNMKI